MVYTFDLSDKVVLITGGYGYLGRGITRSLLYHGASVYVLGRNEKKFRAAFGDPETGEKKLFFETCDISDTESIARAFETVFLKEEKIDTLINNAFYLQGQDPLKMSDTDWKTGIDGTLNSVFKCTREVLPYLEKSDTPRIINVSSMYGMVAPDFSVYRNHQHMLNPPHYGAAKAGVIQLTKYYASFLGPKGITVNAVTPGPFPSDTVRKEEDFIEVLKAKTSLKRIGKPEDLGGAFVFLASEASGYVTGQNIVIDGGWTTV